MSTATEIKKTYNKQQKTQKLLHTIFIISICLMIAAVLCIINSYIEANEYVKVLVATNKNIEYTDEDVANIIADRVSLLNTISFIAIGLGLIGTILFRYLSEKKKKQYLSNEVQLMDCTENKENLYD